MYTSEQSSKLAHWRSRATEGTLTLEEMKEAIALLRQGRAEAAVQRAKAKAKKPKSSTSMLEELEKL